MYYGFIILSTLMFGGCFVIKDIYRRFRKVSDIRMTFESLLIGSLSGVIVLFIINGFKFEFTIFTFIMSLLTALNSFGFTYCSFKALGHINLSKFSLFSMLGGMLLPFIQGILFYNEPFTLSKILCIIFIVIALSLTIEKGDEKKGLIYYLGIFILNGMSGVLAKYYQEAQFIKSSVAMYSIWLALINIVVGFIALLIINKYQKVKEEKLTIKAVGINALSGVFDKVANFLLVLALLHVEASVQYPLVTGGVMIVSTLSCYLLGNKVSKKEVISLILAFIGTLMLFVVPL